MLSVADTRTGSCVPVAFQKISISSKPFEFLGTAFKTELIILIVCQLRTNSLFQSEKHEGFKKENVFDVFVGGTK
jgi:hypothetical protein